MFAVVQVKEDMILSGWQWQGREEEYDSGYSFEEPIGQEDTVGENLWLYTSYMSAFLCVYYTSIKSALSTVLMKFYNT